MAAVNTKELILFRSVELFADKGYDSISMVNIADSVGIKPASIYNHYESKEAILDSAYEYYYSHHLDTRLTPEQYEPILRTGTVKEIVSLINYQFEPLQIMFNLVRLIFARIYIDPKLRELYQRNTVEDSIEYIKRVFLRTRQLGRMRLSDEDIDALAYILLSMRIFGANALVIDPQMDTWHDREIRMFDLIAQLIPLGPPLA